MVENASETTANYKGKILAQWTFSEYEKHQRGPAWYVITVGMAVGLIYYAISTANLLFALMILLLAIILFAHHRGEPLTLYCTIYETGVQVGDRYFLWRELQTFAMVYEPPMVKRMYLYPKKALLRHELSIPLQNQNPLQIRSILLDYVAEDLEKDAESPTDTAARVFKL